MRSHAKARFAVAATTLLGVLLLGTASATAAPPTATLDPVGTTTITTAQLSGTVDPADGETYYCFEYTAEAPEGWSGFCFEGPVAAEAGPTPVSTTLTNLRADTEYTVRLTAWNFNDPEVFSSEETFTTDPLANVPALVLDPTTPSYTTTTISGSVDPEGGNVDPVAGTLPIVWELQTSETGDPGTWGYVAGEAILDAEAEGDDPIAVSAELSGLAPDTSVHYRLFVYYAGQELIAGPNQFTTLAVDQPALTIDPVTSFDATTASLSGSVDPEGDDPAFDTTWRFEYATEADFSNARQSKGGTVSGDGATEVEAKLAKLTPNQTYFVRLAASNQGGETLSDAESFTTPAAPPAVKTLAASKITASSATIHGRLNPRNSQTEYWFAWGPKDCAANPCTSIPLSEDADAGSGNGPIHVREQLGGLSAGQTYHYRLLASNDAGTSAGEGRTFTARAPQPQCANSGAPGVGFLPHCRAWEMVSPADKNGGDIVAKANRTRAALTGGAIAFTSLQGFGDIGGMGVAGEYLAQRTGVAGTSGWSTHALSPRQEQMTVASHLIGAEPKYEWQMSADLTKGIYRAWNPLTGDPDVANMMNFYLRDDLRSPGPGNYQLLTGCPACIEPLPASRKITQSSVSGASGDFNQVVYESRLDLTEGATAGNVNLYESDHGVVRLVGILPSGEPASISLAGQGVTNNQRYTTHVISRDGSRVMFTVPPGEGAEGDLYQRIDHTATIPLNVSERAVPDSPQPAKYWDSATDGSRVFFTSGEALTEDAPISGSAKLYMWERQDHDETQEVAIDAAGGSFTLTFNQRTTELLDHDASAAEVEAALEELASVGPGNVSVSGGPGSPGAPAPYEVTFTGNLSGANVAQLEADGSGLTGGASTASVTTTDPVENLTYLSTDPDGPDLGGGVQGVIGSSDDGRYVYFVASGRVFEGQPQLSSDRAIYLWHEGAISYVGNVERFASDSSALYDGSNFGFTAKESRVTPDGRHVLFNLSSGEGLLSAHGGVDYDHGANNRGQLYVYSADKDELQCASCNPSGAPATATATATTFVNTGGTQPTSNLSHPLSGDGRYVFFSTAERLVPQDTNGQEDAYVYDTIAEGPRLLSSGRSSSPSYFLDASGDGKDVFFITNERLSGWDVDRNYDLYDARIGGGFPEPPPPPPSCQGDACQPAPLQLNDPTPVSSGFKGPGNQSQPRKPRARCPKGKRQVKARGKARCVKKSKQQRKRANANRRASK